MKTSERIIQYISESKQATGNELAGYLNITDRAVRKQLKNLIENKTLIKAGAPPKVFYKLPAETIADNSEIYTYIDNKARKIIENEFLFITPLGEYIESLKGFIRWCEDRKLNLEQQSIQYMKILSEIDNSKRNGIIIATNKISKSFKELYVKELFYLDFYSIPQFGKTKLGQLLLYAKQSQDKQRIKLISSKAKPGIFKVIKKYKIDAIGYIPPTIKREVQFMRELEKNLELPLPIIKISKLRTEIIVPQKSLSKISDRIINARNTIIVEDKRKFRNILLIDDAVGSGATFNETAKQILHAKVAKNVFGLAITGSIKGFDVISEV